MNNQENQPGSSTPNNDARNQNSGTSTGSANAGRKSGAATAQARDASSPSPTARTDREPSNDQNATPSSSSNQNEATDQQGNKMLNTALESGKKWIEDSGVLNSVNDLPQTVKDWSSRAASRVGDLTTTQKIVGGALLAAGIGYLATRKSAGKDDKPQSRYGRQSGSNYGRSSGYQAPDASNSRRTTVGSGRSDSGAAYRSSGTGSGFGSTTPGSETSARTSESSYRSKTDDFRSIE